MVVKEEEQTLQDASALIRGMVHDKKRDMPFNELKKHIKYYLLFAIDSLGNSYTLDIKDEKFKEKEARCKAIKNAWDATLNAASIWIT